MKHRTALLDFLDLVTEVIDFRSFSNLWYWIVLAILWSTLSHWTLGVPFHIVVRARQGHEQARADMEALVEINVRRLLDYVAVSGVVMVASATFTLTALAVLGWGYSVEFCQAVFLLALPMILVAGISVLTARRVQAGRYEDVSSVLRTHRFVVQAMGVVFIFLTALWGMFTNVSVNPLLN